MQQNPIITRIRYAGLAVGVMLFVVMLYRSSQMATNPIYVVGKPYRQNFSALALSSYDTSNVVATASAAATVDSPASNPEPTPPTVDTDGTVAKAGPATSHNEVQASKDLPTPNGKALGIVKQLQ
jgi:hypothetical protein